MRHLPGRWIATEMDDLVGPVGVQHQNLSGGSRHESPGFVFDKTVHGAEIGWGQECVDSVRVFGSPQQSNPTAFPVEVYETQSIDDLFSGHALKSSVCVASHS